MVGLFLGYYLRRLIDWCRGITPAMRAQKWQARKVHNAAMQSLAQQAHDAQIARTLQDKALYDAQFNQAVADEIKRLTQS